MAKKSMKQRKGSRKSRKMTYRKSRREIIGGFIAPVNMGNPVMEESLAQGRSFASYHAGQHGGVADYPTSVSAGPFLSGSMASQAGVAGLDSKWAEIAGMRDQAGGKRRKSRKAKKSKKSRKAMKSRKAKKSRKASRKSRKASRKSRKGSRKHRKGSRKHRKGSRKQRGGVAGASDSYMLLSGSLASKAEAGMSPEWSLAKDPMAFAPK